jgi:Zn-dependent peptidase ImmA (M78 family)
MNLDEIRRQAEDLARKYNPEGKVPFPYLKLGEDYSDLKIAQWEKFKVGENGSIVFLEDKKTYIIIINKNLSFANKNFTTAHELGHYFLHSQLVRKNETKIDGDLLISKNYELPIIRDETERAIEAEATNFAASLIMPTELVTQLWENLKDVQECAHVFGVPLAAMIIRLESLGLLE